MCVRTYKMEMSRNLLHLHTAQTSTAFSLFSPPTLVKWTKKTERMAFKINEPSVAMRSRSIMLFSLVNNVKLQSSLEHTHQKKLAFPLEVPQTDQTSAIRCVRHTFFCLSLSLPSANIDTTGILLHAVPFQHFACFCFHSAVVYKVGNCVFFSFDFSFIFELKNKQEHWLNDSCGWYACYVK